MKKILLIAAVAGLTMASCSKDRTCTCTATPVSETYNGIANTNIGSPTTTVTKLTKVSKKGADCNSGEQTTTATGNIGGTAYTYVAVTKNDCKLS
jgi:hypothetical protein